LRQQIDKAAQLGMPVFLQGDRGSGKTFLAEFAHRRRMVYRQDEESRCGQITIPRSGLSKRDGRPALGPPLDETGGRFVTVPLSQYAGAKAEDLRDELFGWAKGAFSGVGAEQPNDGLIGQAHRGTLFLDEVHHLDRGLQPMLLGPFNLHQFNDRRYKPKMAHYVIISDFYLVLASNDPLWRDKLLPDLCDRLERVVVEVPSFAEVRRSSAHALLQFWDYTLRQRCADCRVEYGEDGEWTECRQALWNLLQSHPLSGNWRDLQRLADNVLLVQGTHRAQGEAGRLTRLAWSRSEVDEALRRTFGATRAAGAAPLESRLQPAKAGTPTLP
jgi:transcriptional regulator with AAA-type ATPase domain